MCGGGLSLPGFGVRMSLPGMRPYLQGGQQGGKVGELLLECLLLFLVLAATEQGMAQPLQDLREPSSPTHPKTPWEEGQPSDRAQTMVPHLCTAFRSVFFLSESCSCKWHSHPVSCSHPSPFPLPWLCPGAQGWMCR